MEKNRKLKFISLIFLSFIVAFFIETFVFNGIKKHNIGENDGVISLDEYLNIEEDIQLVTINRGKTETIDELLKANEIFDLNNLSDENEQNDVELEEIKTYQYTYEFDKKYIDKLIINYNTDNDVNLAITYTGYDEYGNIEEKTLSMGLNRNFNQVNRYIGEDVSKISFKYTIDDSNLKIGELKIKNIINFNFYRYIMIEAFLLSITLIYIFRKIVFEKIEYLFVIIISFIGLTQIFITPCITRYSWDDQIHYERTYFLFDKKYNISKSFDFSLNARDKISNFPTTMEDMNMINEYLNKNNEKIISEKNKESNTISYDYFTYIPSAIVTKLCRILNLPYTIVFILGKITILFIYIAIMYYAIKNAQVGKRLLFVLGLLPSTVFLASQYSRDSIITAGIYLGVSTFMNCYCGKGKMNRTKIMIFLFSILAASLSKPIYIPTLLLILLLPSKKFENKNNSKYVKVLIIGMFLLLMSTFVFPTVTSSSLISDIRGGDTSTKRQLQLIFEQPISFIKVFYKYISYAIFNHTLGYEPFGTWFKFGYIVNTLYYINLLLILYTAFTGDNNLKIDKKCKWSLFLINLFIFCLICGSMYLSYTPVATTTVIGAQPRYYLPLLFGFLLCLKSNNIKNNITNKKFGIMASTIMIYILYYSTYYKIFMTICV